MSEDPSQPPPRETVEGLDPRALFARAGERFDVSALLRAWEPPPIEEAAQLFPQYELLAFIGRGGMGAVYRARQPNLDRLVAIKLMPAEAAADDAFAARFRVEARALAKLQHPNIVAIYEFGQTREGHLFFVMEYVDGTDLARLIQTGELGATQALEIASRVCAALQFAHEHGIVHRDIKPANILVYRSGLVKVADFGLAKLRPGGDVARSQHSVSGAVIGTPDYMAPEQLDGREVDARADIYSLGVMLYEMLTGQLPRGAWELPSRKAHTDTRLDGVVTKALQTEPDRRYQQASEVRTAVDGIRTTPEPKSRVGLRWAAAVPLLAGLVWLVLSQFPHRPIPPSEPAPAVATPAPAPKTILGALDLPSEIVEGEWRWRDGRAGSALLHSRRPPTISRRIRIPIQPQGRAYKLSFTLLLQAAAADAGVILPIADTQTGLALHLNDASGLGLVQLKRWDFNESTTSEPVPVGRDVHFVVKVRPYSDQVAVDVEMDGSAFIRWSGPQRDLTLYDDPNYGWSLQDRESFGFATYAGGIEISDVAIEFLP